MITLLFFTVCLRYVGFGRLRRVNETVGCEANSRSHWVEDIDHVSSKSVLVFSMLFSLIIMFLLLTMSLFLFFSGLRVCIFLGFVSCSVSASASLSAGSSVRKSVRRVKRLERGTVIAGLSRLLLRVVCGVSVKVLLVVGMVGLSLLVCVGGVGGGLV